MVIYNYTFVCPSVETLIYVSLTSIRLAVPPSVYWFAHLYVQVSVYSSVSPAVRSYDYPSVRTSVLISVCPYIRLSVRQFVPPRFRH